MNKATDDTFGNIDDRECVDYILSHIADEYRGKITDVEIYYVLDLIDLYYYDSDLVDENTDEMQEADINEEEMLDYIMAAVKKEQVVTLTEDEVSAILDAEYEYGKANGMYIE